MQNIVSVLLECNPIRAVSIPLAALLRGQIVGQHAQTDFTVLAVIASGPQGRSQVSLEDAKDAFDLPTLTIGFLGESLVHQSAIGAGHRRRLTTRNGQRRKFQQGRQPWGCLAPMNSLTLPFVLEIPHPCGVQQQIRPLCTASDTLSAGDDLLPTLLWDGPRRK